METIHLEAVADGQPSMTSVEVVSKVISPTCSTSTFFKNTGIATLSSKTLSTAEYALHQQLAAEKQGVAALHDEVVDLKKRSEAAKQALAITQQQFEELNKQEEENNLILKRILMVATAGTPSQP
ncbi:hypothetical protein PVAP13_3KG511000 [Panicum virgatum]|uniref:Uncharacterized protein n=1 Tax=Panicum virgatum TaxID=38727 RepID=A0A8T0V997_PANVG|nr:hypothetical protein PVAP13_3KG511000 [Panicum virgatum]